MIPQFSMPLDVFMEVGFRFVDNKIVMTIQANGPYGGDIDILVLDSAGDNAMSYSARDKIAGAITNMYDRLTTEIIPTQADLELEKPYVAAHFTE